MPDVKSNEREFSSQVVSWLNEFISTGTYPFKDVTGETSIRTVGETTKFPDVQIWLDRSAKQGFCGWELKTPATRADDPELLEAAAAKARAMNADQFVTWNMRHAILWRTPQPLIPVSSSDRVKEYPSIVISLPDDMWTDRLTAARLKERAAEILNDLKTLYFDHTLHQIEADTNFFVGRLSKAVEALFPVLRDALLQRVGGDSKFRQSLQAWGTKQGIANVTAANFYQAVAKQIIYRLLVRILFYLTLQKQWRERLPELGIGGLTGREAREHLKEVFSYARDVDWHAVFEEGLPDEIEMPDSAIREIDSLLIDLKRFSFSHMPHDVIGAVFEKLIPQTERHQLGQYFTPENLVDLVLAFCVRERDDKVLDPTCGTGTFLLRAYNKKMRHLGLVDHKRLLPQIWGVDIAHFPAELATINLFRQDLSNYANFPRIIVKDFFEINPGDSFDFPPPKVDPSSGITKIKEAIPLFDAAVGNFPFIRQELIEKLEKGYKAKLEQVIKNDWLSAYPDAFDIQGNRETIVAELNRNPYAVFDDIDLNLSGQADIYAYLYFHCGRFIKEGGRMGFITSNSWLDVAYGYELQKYMVNNFKIVAVLESRCEPWFEDAAVNTVVTVLERCSNSKNRDENIVSFVKIKKKLADLIPWDPKVDPAKRWYGLDGLVQQIEGAADKHCYVIDGASRKCTLNDVGTADDDDFRIRFVKQSDLKNQLLKEKKTAKWGQYLRAPQVYFDLFEQNNDKFLPLREVSDIKFGIKTGINEFFYPSSSTIEHFGIEDDYLLPIIKSPRNLSRIYVNKYLTSTRLFVCNLSKEELRRRRKLGALKYIEYSEKQITPSGIPYPDVPSVRGRTHWWSLDDITFSDFFVIAFQGERTFFPINEDGVLVSDVFFQGSSKIAANKDILSAWLNSSLNSLLVQTHGRTNLGEGVLKFIGPEIDELLVPKIQLITLEKRIQILEAFQKVTKRPVKPIFEEIKLKDRQQLDGLILEALGLDPAKYLRHVYDSLTELVRERIDLAAMRKKQKQAKVIRNIGELVEQVSKDLIAEGIKTFPDDFLTCKPKPQDCMSVQVPNAPLKFGHYFMGRQRVIDGSGYDYDAPSIAAAKYIIYARKPGEYVICLPYIESLSPKETEKAEALVSRAVQNYESYLKDLFQKINQELLNRTFDHKQAETLSRRIFQELDLPLIA
ncbi:HsdM family class I SAM-dependent methyltransferase [Dehalogenimonas etheniformans]|nr:N-6 DNA methylase [Dehalogenimonas etheniformans]QNT76117.1 N-6 DNA methylase [Dehalogenimonas etheniformans]